MPHLYDLQFRDFSDEISTHQVNISPITVGTIVAELAEIAAYRSAVEGITLGIAARDKIIMDDTLISAARPVSAVAQREMKWLVRYHGVTDGKKWTCEIPTADLTLANILVPGTDIMDLTQAQAATWKTAFETMVRPPGDDTQLVVVDQVVFVGRNL